MPSDFTVIQEVRQEFGNGLGNEFPFEQQAPKVGNAKDFRFACPGIDSGQPAVLQFETLGVHAGLIFPERNILRLNGFDIPGGITPGPPKPNLPNLTGERVWKSHCLTVPANILRTQNVLHIEAIEFPPGPVSGVRDRFIVDNIVVFFKTRSTAAPGGGTANPGAAASRARKAQAVRKARPAERAKAKTTTRAKSPTKRSK